MQNRMLLLTALIALGIQVILPGPAVCQPDRYAGVVQRLDGLKGTTYARIAQIGRSESKRPIYAIALTSPNDTDSIASERMRLLVMCGQHGDESSSVMAMLSLAEELSETQNPFYQSIMRRAVLVIIPVANPDGFAHHRRINANGADLNRNWSVSNQAETTTVSRFVSKVRPHVIIDEHEWTDTSPWRANSVEIAGYGQGNQYKLQRLLTRAALGSMSGDGLSFNVVHYRPETDHRLAHRHFAGSGICSILLETSPRWSPVARHRAYRDFTMGVLSTIAFPRGGAIADNVHLAMNKRRHAEPLLANLYMPTSSMPMNPVGVPCGLALVFIAGYVLLRYAGNRLLYPHMGTISPARPVRITITDALALSVSPRTKLAVIRMHKSRPTDRQSVKMKAKKQNPPSSRTPIGLQRMRTLALYR